MAITHVAAGAEAHDSGSGGNITPGMPAGCVTDDIVLGHVAQADNVVGSVPLGWTIELATNQSATLRQTVFWKRFVTGDVAPLFTRAGGNAITGRLYAFRGCTNIGDPIEAILATGAAGTANPNTLTANAITPLNANAAILFLCCEEFTGNTSGAPTWGSYSGTNPTFAEIGDNNNGLNSNMISAATAWGIKTDTTTTGNRTAVVTGEVGIPTAVIGLLLALSPYVYVRPKRGIAQVRSGLVIPPFSRYR